MARAKKPFSTTDIFPSVAIIIVRTYIEDITRWRDVNFMFEWQEHNIHIFEPTCIKYSFYYMEKSIQQKQKAGIVTSLNDTTLTKVTYGKYATRVPDEVAYGIYEWFSSQ